MTGRHGWEVGMSSAFGWTAFGRDSMLLPSMLKELGYRTAVVGKLHLNPKTCRHFQTGGRFGCGIDHQYGFIGGMSDYYNHHATWSRDGVRLRETGYMTELLAAEAERLVHSHANGAHGNQSLFLWLSLNAPHVPLQAPDEWLQKQRADLDPTVRTYAAMVGAMDDAFGRAARALR
jgi:arylsulfatase A-like enzyme